VSESDFVSYYVTVKGRVQGVGYRAWCAAEAESRGLSGWIRNRRDGFVEAVYHGRADRVKEMVALSEEGPELARIDRILAHPCDPPDVAGFVRRPTY